MRYDVKVVFTQEWTFVEDTDTPLEAQRRALEAMQMPSEARKAPEVMDLHTTVTKGFG